MFRLIPVGVLLLTVFASTNAPGQTWATGLFKETQHNFGVVARSAKTTHVFEFTNTTGSTIHIGGVRTSCNCTTPTVLTPVVEPGHVGQILAQYNTHSHLGQKGANLTVSFNSPSYTEVQLRVDGFIRGDVMIEPGEVNFGNVIGGDDVVKSVLIQYIGKPSWAINRVHNPNDNIKTELVEVKREGGSIHYKLNVTLSNRSPIGFFNEQIRLVTNETNKTVPLMINGRVDASIQVPSVVDLGRIKSGETVNKVVIVKAHRAFTVIGVENADSRVEVVQPSESKKTHLIRLTFNANREGQLADEVILKTDDPSMPEARIKVTGDVTSDAK